MKLKSHSRAKPSAAPVEGARLAALAPVGARPARAGFTLAEVLAALALMAIVIPVAVDGLRVASLAGEVSQRKEAAGRVAERVLNEWLISRTTIGSSQRGLAQEGIRNYSWTIQSESWREDTLNRMNLVTVSVAFQVQGREYNVRLSTLLAPSTL